MKSADACGVWAEQTGLTNFHRCAEGSHTEYCASACNGKVTVEADYTTFWNLKCPAQKDE